LEKPLGMNWGQAINLLTYFIPLLVPPCGGMGVYLEKTLLRFLLKVLISPAGATPYAHLLSL